MSGIKGKLRGVRQHTRGIQYKYGILKIEFTDKLQIIKKVMIDFGQSPKYQQVLSNFKLKKKPFP